MKQNIFHPRYFGTGLGRALPLITCCVFLFLLFSNLAAQNCTLACANPSPQNPGNISPGQNCMATVAVDTVVTNSGGCTGSFWLVVRTLSGDTIAVGTDLVDIPAFDHLNTIIEIQVKNIATGNFCSSYYFVEDKQPPAITACPSDTVACNASLDPANLAPIVFGDNCDGDPDTSYFDVNMAPDCFFPNSMFIGVIVRTWTVTDAAGNTANCDQFIYILKPDTSQVTIPGMTLIDCASPSADPSVAGYPTLAGNPLQSGGLCGFTVVFNDDTLTTCGGNLLILRHWTVSNNCVLSEIKTGTQQIKFEDTTPPVITCPGTITIPTDDGFCNADITPPAPTVTDNCSPYFVSAEITGFAGFQNVPKGTYSLVYTATDSCFNASTCTTTLIVADNETPTAICDEFKIVGLPNTGQAVIPAAIFDDGSTDNCSPLTFLVSRDGINFSSSATFDCNDVGDTVMVVLRVRELVNPASFTDCMNFVVVQDKLPPTIICPAPQTVECTSDYSNLSIFGSPTVIENCTVSMTEVANSNISNCGVGTITRTFTATDASGNSASCTQTITVVNNNPYNGSTIQWPADYTVFNTCKTADHYDPEDLPTSPVNYSVPVVSTNNCAMIAKSYSDQLFYVSYPACYKIVRTWKIIDWCQYNPSNPNVGKWTHQQVIAIMDNIAPVITSCPADTIVSVGADCGVAFVNLPPVTATDCSTNLVFTNTSPYNGANASGNYPQGINTVTFTVKDGCGNKSTCTTKITVTDLVKPTPYCNTGIVAELQAMGDQIMATINANQLNFNSFDNCTPKSALQFNIGFVGHTQPPATTALTLDCSYIGTFLVELWVTDLAGNSDYCITNIIIQDNMQLCPPVVDDTLVVVAGEIKTETGEQLPGVNINAISTGMTTGTNASGVYQLGGLQNGGSYTIAPEKDNGYLNGITTFDLVLMSRHVLGISLLNSPYKIIAADINKSGMVTTSDIVELRKLILHINDKFTNNTSWRFVKKDFVFPNPANPFATPFPEVVNVANISQDVLDANFVGVKIGDMNCSANVNFNGSDTGDRSGGGEITLLLDDRELQAGEEFTVPFRVKDYQKLIAIQFTLEFETDDLELRGMEEGVLSRAGEQSFGLANPADGVVTAAWFDTNPVAVTKEDALFSLHFTANRSGRLSEMLKMTSQLTQALAYDAGENSMNLNLAYTNYDEMMTIPAFQLYQNQPNPFKKATHIRFSLPEAGWAKLTIYDVSGQVLKSYDQHFNEGFNQLTVERDELPSGGVLFYQLETPEHKATKKMILLQ
jgi:hypothetical protein